MPPLPSEIIWASSASVCFWTVADDAFRSERGSATSAVLTAISVHNRDNKESKTNKKQRQNCESKNHMALSGIFFHGFSFASNFLLGCGRLLEMAQRSSA